MELALAQIAYIKDDLTASIAKHVSLATEAAGNGAALIVFPELSLTGYETTSAASLATHIADTRFDPIQHTAIKHNIIIAAGMPLTAQDGINIGLILFHPNGERQPYFKKYLHSDELPFFITKENTQTHIIGHNSIQLSICYELSVPEHSRNAAAQNGQVYINSSAKTSEGVKKAYETLQIMATNYKMKIGFCNSVGPSDDFVAAGGSATWDQHGTLLQQLGSNEEGILYQEI